MKLAISIAALVLSAGLAHADGFSVKDTYIAAPARVSSCYVKAFGAGNFVNTDNQVMGLATINMGSADLGIGGQIGCDISSGLFFVGVMADYTWHKQDSQIVVGGVPVLSTPFGNEASIGARMGVMSSGNTGIYGLVAYTTAQDRNASMMGVPLNLNGPKGVTLGGGIETTLAQHLVLSLEYRHTGFDTRSSSVLPMVADTIENQVRVGVGYKF